MRPLPTEAFMRRILVILFAAPFVAQAAPYPYTMSGARFVHMMNRPQPLSGEDYMLREKAYSYLDGVRDGSEGIVWCDFNEFKTPDMAYDLADRIAKLPAVDQRKNASLLILDQLKQMHPCRKAGARS